ncbi:hypothetical protein GCM10022267_75800 [Lentzea roselyniae]|uniref:Uncharacterized protein n=1 Tax=Lentzea roselyniae TaxID=531940 RepID=A0ABP7C2Q6_9PSEU
MWQRRARGREPHLVAAGCPPALLVPALVRNLATVVDGRAAYCVLDDDETATVACWPAVRIEPAANLDAALAAHRATEVRSVAGGGWLMFGKRGQVSRRDRQVLEETAGWIGVAVRMERLRGDRDRSATRAARLDSELRVARERVARVRELERRRLVGSITSLAGREFADVRRKASELRGAFAGTELDPGAAGAAADRLRDALDELVGAFRTVVRGVHPAMLPERGPRAALEELAMVLRRPVRFRGDLGHRVSWEIESGLYHAAAAVLHPLTAPGGAERVVVDCARAESVLRVVMTAPGWAGPAAQLRQVLCDDAERLTVLGGTLTTTVHNGVATVSIELPERLSAPGAEAGCAPGDSLFLRVRALVERGWLAAADRAAGERWTAIAERLNRPVRVAVVGPSHSTVVGALIGARLPDSDTPAWHLHGSAAAPDSSLILLDLPGEADTALAAQLTSPVNGDAAAVDAVLCLAPADQAFRRALRLGRHRVELVEPPAPLHPRVALWSATGRTGHLSEDDARLVEEATREDASVADVVGELSGLAALKEALTRRFLTRFELIAARRALAAVREAVGDLPPNHPLVHEVERITATAHEIVELELLDELEWEAPSPNWFGPLEVCAEAVQLLGAFGTSPNQRLGLTPSADAAQLCTAAWQAASRWRARGEHLTAGPRVRAACEVLVRTCEGIAADLAPQPEPARSR